MTAATVHGTVGFGDNYFPDVLHSVDWGLTNFPSALRVGAAVTAWPATGGVGCR